MRVLLFLTLCFARPAMAVAAAVQTPASQTPASQAPANHTPANPAPAAKPVPALRPYPAERQPPLNVDRDPVPSPDPEVAPSASSSTSPLAPPSASGSISAPSIGSAPGTVSRSKSGGYTLRSDVDEVVLNATVLDDKGHLINTLDKSDFKITEDGAPQTILSFLHEDIPVSLGFLIDNSGSMRSKREAVNKAALDLVRASNTHDESFIVNFADEAFLDQEFTSDINKLREGLARIDSKGGTALYDSVVAAADELSKDAKRSKQVILIITDGEDTASSLTLEQAIRRVQDLQGPVIYSIGILFDESGHESKRARRALKLLSDDTGGIAFFPKSLAQIDDIAAEVAHDIRSQYTIGYHSTKPVSVPGYRSVKVEAKNKAYSRLTVRTRSGYFPKGDKASPTPKAGQ